MGAIKTIGHHRREAFGVRRIPALLDASLHPSERKAPEYGALQTLRANGVQHF
jgi:hypothetical protein